MRFRIGDLVQWKDPIHGYSINALTIYGIVIEVIPDNSPKVFWFDVLEPITEVARPENMRVISRSNPHTLKKKI